MCVETIDIAQHTDCNGFWGLLFNPSVKAKIMKKWFIKGGFIKDLLRYLLTLLCLSILRKNCNQRSNQEEDRRHDEKWNYSAAVVTLFTFPGRKRKLESELSLLPNQFYGIRFLPVLN